MYPVLFRVAGVEITSFGALLAVAVLTAIWLFRRELARSGLPDDAVNAAFGGVFGGLLGAKVIWTLEFMGEAPPGDLLFSRGGLSWYGGAMGGVGTGLWMLRRYRVPLVRGLSAAAPALALGHAIGRVGCFFVGDDYGRPTNLPWGVAFPLGLPPTSVPVHPTQLYEAFLLAPLALLLIHWRRSGVADRVVWGWYLVLAGLIRFMIEFVRVNRQILGPFTLAQLLAAGLIVAGVAILAGKRDAS
jgi:phosphatidylglycerol:prolipoprotein diacylglycerol transferase